MADKEPKLADPTHELNPDVYRVPDALVEPLPEEINPAPVEPEPVKAEPEKPAITAPHTSGGLSHG